MHVNRLSSFIEFHVCTSMCSCPGLLRAIDPGKKLFYITTPMSSRSLEQVNVLVLGNPDDMEMKKSGTKHLAVSGERSRNREDGGEAREGLLLGCGGLGEEGGWSARRERGRVVGKDGEREGGRQGGREGGWSARRERGRVVGKEAEREGGRQGRQGLRERGRVFGQQRGREKGQQGVKLFLHLFSRAGLTVCTLLYQELQTY